MSSRFHRPWARLEIPVEGAFTIAMTLLILEGKLPEPADPKSMLGLPGSLRHALPTDGI